MSKIKPLFGIGISILFVIIGIHLIFEKSTQVNTSKPLLVKMVGIACVLFLVL